MQTHGLSPAQLRQLGIEALVRALGAVGMARFLQQLIGAMETIPAIALRFWLTSPWKKRSPKSSKPVRVKGEFFTFWFAITAIAFRFL